MSVSMIDNREKIRRMIHYLTVEHLEFDGGYPYDYVIDRGVVHVAGLDVVKDLQATQITSYRLQDLVVWYDSAVQYIVDYNQEREDDPDEELLSDEWLEDDWRVSESWYLAFSECEGIKEYVTESDDLLEDK